MCILYKYCPVESSSGPKIQKEFMVGTAALKGLLTMYHNDQTQFNSKDFAQSPEHSRRTLNKYLMIAFTGYLFCTKIWAKSFISIVSFDRY